MRINYLLAVVVKILAFKMGSLAKKDWEPLSWSYPLVTNTFLMASWKQCLQVWSNDGQLFSATISYILFEWALFFFRFFKKQAAVLLNIHPTVCESRLTVTPPRFMHFLVSHQLPASVTTSDTCRSCLCWSK